MKIVDRSFTFSFADILRILKKIYLSDSDVPFQSPNAYTLQLYTKRTDESYKRFTIHSPLILHSISS